METRRGLGQIRADRAPNRAIFIMHKAKYLKSMSGREVSVAPGSHTHPLLPPRPSLYLFLSSRYACSLLLCLPSMHASYSLCLKCLLPPKCSIWLILSSGLCLVLLQDFSPSRQLKIPSVLCQPLVMVLITVKCGLSSYYPPLDGENGRG